MPVSRLDQSGWIHAPRLPLGDPFRGICHARPEQPFEPPESSLHELCNCGYARFRCDHFPPESVADAVRFSVASEDLTAVRLVYVMEKSHAPAQHGILEYAIGEARFVNGEAGSILNGQALAFIGSYFSRRLGPEIIEKALLKTV
jgi:hypothetical protein